MNGSRLRHVLPPVVVHLLLCGVHAVFVAGSPLVRFLTLDLQSYDLWARAIAAGDWIGKEVFYQDPLYPYLMALVYRVSGAEIEHLLALQVLASAAVVVLVHRIAAQLYSSGVALAAAWLAALYGPSVYYAGKPEKATFAAFFLTLALCCWFEARSRGPRWLLGSGVATGLAALLRGNVLLLGLAAVAVLVAARRLRAVTWFATGMFVVLLPVLARNRWVGEDWVFTTSQAGANLYIGNHPGNTSGSYTALPFVRPSPRFEAIDFRRYAERRLARPLKPSEVSRFYVGEVLRWARAEPSAFLRLQAMKTLAVFDQWEYPDNWSIPFVRRFSPVLRLPLLSYGLILPFAVLGVAVTLAPPRREDRIVVAGVALAYGLSVIAFYVFSRYRYPIVPCLLILAAGGAARLLAVARARRYGRLALWTSAIAALYALSFLAKQNPEAGDLAQRHANLGAEMFVAGRISEAAQWCEDAIALDPNSALAHLTLARVAARRGDRAAEQRHLENAYRARPADAEVAAAMVAATARRDGYAAAAGLAESLLRRGEAYRVRQTMVELALDDGRTDEAVDRLRALLGIYPQDEWALAKIAEINDPGAVSLREARALAGQGQSAAAIARLETVLARDPGNASAWHFLSNVHFLAGDSARARQALERAAALEPENALYRRNLAALRAAQ